MSGAAAQASGFVPSILMIGWQPVVACVPVLDQWRVVDVPLEQVVVCEWSVTVENSP